MGIIWTPEIIWTPSRMDQITYCRMKHHLIKKLKIKTFPNGRMARGIHIHKITEKFYNGQGKPKKKSAEAFANASGATWSFIINKGIIQSKKIKWKNEKEPYYLKKDIKELSKLIYKRYSKEKPPIFTEVPFEFILDGRHFKGRIDEIRYGPKIRDIKTGRREPGIPKLTWDPQFTIYCLAVCCLAYHDKKFAELIGVPDERRKEWLGNPVYLSDIIDMEYYFLTDRMKYENITKKDVGNYVDFLISTGDIKEKERAYSIRLFTDFLTFLCKEKYDENDENELQVRRFVKGLFRGIKEYREEIFPMKRGNIQYHDLCNTIDKFEKEIIEERNIYAERGRNCDYCEVYEECNRYSYEIFSGKKTSQDQFGLFGNTSVIVKPKPKIKYFKLLESVPVIKKPKIKVKQFKLYTKRKKVKV